jgi:hypothetical protein
MSAYGEVYQIRLRQNRKRRAKKVGKKSEEAALNETRVHRVGRTHQSAWFVTDQLIGTHRTQAPEPPDGSPRANAPVNVASKAEQTPFTVIPGKTPATRICCRQQHRLEFSKNTGNSISGTWRLTPVGRCHWSRRNGHVSLRAVLPACTRLQRPLSWFIV